MADNDKKLPVRDAAVLAANLTAAAALKGTGFAFMPLGTSLVIAAGFVTTLWGRIGERKAANAYATFVEQWSTVNMMPTDEAEAEVRRLLTEGDPAHDDKLYEAFRHLAFVRSDAAWAYIARMTAMYTRESRPADDFFRRAGWLLERCETDDVEVFVRAARTTREMLASGKYPTYDRVQWHAHETDGVIVYVRETDDGEASGGSYGRRARPRDIEAIDLLGAARLGHPTETGRVKFPRGELLDRLLDLFNTV